MKTNIVADKDKEKFWTALIFPETAKEISSFLESEE